MHYNNALQPWLAVWGVFWTTIFILINGFAVFFKFNASDFLVACESPCLRLVSSSFLLTLLLLDLNIPLFFALYFGWKIIKRTKIWKPEEMDFHTVRIHADFYCLDSQSDVSFHQGIPTLEETEIPEQPPRTIGEKIAAIVF